MFIGALLLLGLFAVPLWNITLIAPQYPEPLGLNIHINKLSDGIEFNDVNNIDLLNHYIGMHKLPSEHNIETGDIEPFKEFTYMPIIIVFLSIVGFIVAFIGRRKLYAGWFFLVSLFGLIGVYDFSAWLQKYGSELDPNAILKMTDPNTGEIMAYNPPLFGYKKLLNFEVFSYPSAGAYLIFGALLLAILAYFVAKKEVK